MSDAEDGEGSLSRIPMGVPAGVSESRGDPFAKRNSATYGTLAFTTVEGVTAHGRGNVHGGIVRRGIEQHVLRD